MRVLIRADASSRIGTGHVARCLTLADALRVRGVEVTFACRELDGHRIETVLARGYAVVRLPADYLGEDATAPIETGIPWEADCAALQHVLGPETAWDWLVVDHYGLDGRWQVAMRGFARHIAVIDDLSNRAHDADLLLDHNATAERAGYEHLTPAHCRRLLGPKYALVAEGFGGGAMPVTAQAQRVLINFGGGDAAGATLKVVRALDGLHDMRLEIVAGGMNPDWHEIEAIVARHPHWRLHRFVDDFAGLMRSVDCFVGAGGSTTWERAALGLPTICIAIAPNQQPNATMLAALGAHLYLGEMATLDGDTIRHAVSLLLGNAGLRQSFAAISHGLVDGQGTDRVVDAMTVADLTLRAATMADAQLLFEGRNQPEVRYWSINREPIPWAAHVQWLERTLVAPDRLLLIAESTDGPVGVLRYDLLADEPDVAEVSSYVLAGRSGHGWATAMLVEGDALAMSTWPALQRVRALIRGDNAASQRLFTKAGYRLFDCHFERTLRGEPK